MRTNRTQVAAVIWRLLHSLFEPVRWIHSVEKVVTLCQLLWVECRACER